MLVDCFKSTIKYSEHLPRSQRIRLCVILFAPAHFRVNLSLAQKLASSLNGEECLVIIVILIPST